MRVKEEGEQGTLKPAILQARREQAVFLRRSWRESPGHPPDDQKFAGETGLEGFASERRDP
jgi:hypothetical protein